MRNLIPVRARPMHRGAIFTAFIIACALFIAPSAVSGQNGSVDFTLALCGNTPQSSGIDLAYDTLTNTIWVLDQGSGQVCRYTLSAFPPDIVFDSSVNHPFGAAAPPFFTPLCVGLTYDPVSQNFLLLNGTTLQLIQMDPTGLQVGLPAVLTPPAGGSLTGLAFDTVTGNVWSRDTINHLAVEFDPATGGIVSQIPLPGEAIIYGSGIHFVNDLGVRNLEFTRGGVLDFGASGVIRIDALTGAEQCIEVDLTQAPEPILGIVRPPTGTVIYATSTTSVYKIDATQGVLTPPSDLLCLNNVNGTVDLTWTNCGNGAGGLYSSIRILRDGAVIDILAGNVTNYTDSAPTPIGGQIVYQVVGVEGATTSPSFCTVQTGPGGLVSFQPFDGSRPFDLALDPDLGELYVTDNFSDQIFVYDTDLNLVRVLATTLQNLQGIAYDTSLDTLIVSRSGSTILNFVDPLSGVVAPNSLPIGSGIDMVALSYDGANDCYLALDANANPPEVLLLDADPMTPGNLKGTISPPGVTGLALSNGVCHLAASNTVLTTIQAANGTPSSVSELFPNGFPSGFTFPTTDIGGSLASQTAIRGIEDFANVLFMAGSATNTIFRMLIASGGANFIRGDVNDDLTVDIADATAILGYIFTGGAAPSCDDAADVNDSGSLDISDPLYLLLHLFMLGPQPPAPFPAAGPDPTFLDPFSC